MFLEISSSVRTLQLYLKIVTLAAFTLGFVAIHASDASAQTFTALYSFTDSTKGSQPAAGLVRDSAGNLYGTSLGGTHAAGNVFKLDTSENLTEIYNFTGGSDGSEPMGTLIRDSSGNLYGVTAAGGDTTTGCTFIDGTPGCGTIFKVTEGGNLHVLHTFHGGTDGANPVARLFADSAGNLYGTTYFGGSSNKGTVYKLSPSGTLTVLHSFTGGAGGANPRSRVILDSKGNVYGTIPFGGPGPCACGFVYKLTPAGTLTILHNFAGGSDDGANPFSGLLWDRAGNMYGTTISGGTGNCDGDPCGTVYKVRTNGTEALLFSFDGGNTPSAAELALDSAGNLYGVTQGDNRGSNLGTVFELAPDGTESVLYQFQDGLDGSDPVGTLILDSKGNIYGTSDSFSGSVSRGAIFKITPE
jgi:uncharacterized repeat protein (TIGR03803 family)